MNKTTNKEMFAIVMEMVQLADVPQAEMDMALAFLQTRVDQLDAKQANKKLTKAQEENEAIKATLEVALAAEDGLMSIAQIQKSLPGFDQYSNQKLSALLNQMVKAEVIVKAVGTDRKTTFGFEKPKTKIEKAKTSDENQADPIGDSRVADPVVAYDMAMLYQAYLDGDITEEDYNELTA